MRDNQDSPTNIDSIRAFGSVCLGLISFFFLIGAQTLVAELFHLPLYVPDICCSLSAIAAVVIGRRTRSRPTCTPTARFISRCGITLGSIALMLLGLWFLVSYKSGALQRLYT